MYTHICMLSEQPSPNIIPPTDPALRASHVICVVTPQQENRYLWVESVLREQGIKVDRLAVADAFDYPTLASQLDQLVREQKNRTGEALVINATGGTKPMSIAAYMAGYQNSVPVFYVHADRTNWLFPEDRQPQALAEKIKINHFLRAHGYTIKESRREQLPHDLYQLFEKIAGTSSYRKAISTLNYHATFADPDRAFTLQDSDLRNLAFQALLDELVAAELITGQGLLWRFRTEQAHQLLKGEWLEQLIYRRLTLLKRQNGSIQDIARNLVADTASGTRNELDIAVLANNHLTVLECKTVRFSADGVLQASDALYKLSTVTKTFGGSQGRGILVSLHTLKEADLQRAKDLGIKTICGDDFASSEHLNQKLTALLTTAGQHQQ